MTAQLHGTAPDRAADPLAALVAAAAGGDGASMEQLLRRLLPRVRNLIRYLTRNDQDVDDIAQLVLAVIARKLDTFAGTGLFTSWADRIVARETFAAIKRDGVDRRQLAAVAVDELAGAGATTIADAYFGRRELVYLLDQLSDEQRAALVLHHVLGLTVAEIAEQSDLSDETVRSRLRLGKARMRQLASPRDGANKNPEERR